MGGMFNKEMGVQISYLAGTINNTEKQNFQKLIYRASRGRVLCYFDDSSFTIKDFEGTEKTRVVYILVFQQVSYLRDRIMRVCESFQGKVFHLPDDGQSGP